jgi:hypothetical protein
MAGFELSESAVTEMAAFAGGLRPQPPANLSLFRPTSNGVHVNPEFGLVRSAHDPRQIQFAVRYAF